MSARALLISKREVVDIMRGLTRIKYLSLYHNKFNISNNTRAHMKGLYLSYDI